MEPLKLKKALADKINQSLENDTFKTGIQDDLDHQIANICFKTLRYIDKNYGKDIYSNTAITDKNEISDIQKLLIYIFIIFYFHSENDDIRNNSDFITSYEGKINERFEFWFEKNKYATFQKSIGITSTYRPFKKTLENKDTKATDGNINNYRSINKPIIFSNNLQKLITNAVVSIRKNDYNILTALLSDPYYISDNFEVGLSHPNVPNKIIKAFDFASGDYGLPLDIQPANLIQIGGVDINLAIGGTHYLINNIVFDNNTNFPVVIGNDKKYIKVLDFMPVKNITAANVTRITNMADVDLIANITTNLPQLTLEPLDANDPKVKYFSHKLVDNDNKYEHEFNNVFPFNGNNSLKFELYVIKEP